MVSDRNVPPVYTLVVFLATNLSISPQTKHIDIRYLYITELIENGLIKVKFVKTEENDSDGFTKNLIGELHDKQKTKFIINKDEMKNFHEIANRNINQKRDTG